MKPKAIYIYDDDRVEAVNMAGQLFGNHNIMQYKICIRGDDDYNTDRYSKEFLFSDEEADETQCSYKQTSYMANIIGGLIVNLFTNFVANEVVEGLRDLPFFTSYDGGSMMFKTEQ